MQWLIANIWMALAAATVLGLLLGFSFRGLLVGARIRRAVVEREIAKTELTQSKAEVDALYSAQRKRKEEAAQAVGGDPGLRAELDERESRIASLGDELASARAELERLQIEGGDTVPVLETVGAAAAGAIAGAALSRDDSEQVTQLADRNAWLEQRVSALEADLVAAAAPPPALPIEPEAVAVDTTNEKLLWQTAYLRQRVEALEHKIVNTETPVETEPAPEPVQAPVLVVAEDPVESVSNETASTKEADEELARLRWRNRYLEGRLAYFEQSDEEALAEPEDAPALASTLAEEAPEADAEPEGAVETEEAEEPELEAEAEPETQAAPETEAVAPTPVALDDNLHPSEAMLAELDGTQPEQCDQPGNGGQDLTAITGIGPRIAEVLNELGIWTYAQISTWLPEHETWIENHLAFKGRVSRENWIGQAKILSEQA